MVLITLLAFLFLPFFSISFHRFNEN
uniref:Uncharacterized protein n=1 Tax=Rhizophora mucronata TaxID=61149 RepID=A0A2P2NY30_RHIMU